MKVSKLITIDVEIAEKLKQTNASALINDLLKQHFEIRQGKNSLFEEKKAIFDNLKKKMAQTRKEFKIISKFEKLQIDTFAYRWIKGQEREPSIHSISAYKNGRRLNIPSENFIQAWKLIQEHGNLFEKER